MQWATQTTYRHVIGTSQTMFRKIFFLAALLNFCFGAYAQVTSTEKLISRMREAVVRIAVTLASDMPGVQSPSEGMVSAKTSIAGESVIRAGTLISPGSGAYLNRMECLTPFLTTRLISEK